MKHLIAVVTTFFILLTITPTAFAQLAGGTRELPSKIQNICETIDQENCIFFHSDIDKLFYILENTQSENSRMSGLVKITTPFDMNAMMNLRIFTSISRVKDAVSQSYRFKIEAEEREDKLNADGSFKIVSDPDNTFVRFGKFNIETTDEEASEVLNSILDEGLNSIIANQYLRLDFLDELQNITNDFDSEFAEGLELLQVTNTDSLEILKKFLRIANNRVLTITSQKGKYTIRPARSISPEDTEAFAEDFFNFLMNDLGMSESLAEEMAEAVYEEMDDMLSEINKNASVYLQIYTEDNKISRTRFLLRSRDPEVPVSMFGNFRYLKRAPRNIFMPRCYIDMVDLLGILQTIGLDPDNSYFKQSLEQLKDQKTCQ